MDNRGIDRIGELYGIEREIRGLSADARRGEPASRTYHCTSCPARLLRLGHPLQSRQPEIIGQVLEIGCAELLRGGRLVELFPEWSDERFPLYAVYPSRLHRAAKVRSFIEFCLEIMGGNQNAVPRKTR